MDLFNGEQLNPTLFSFLVVIVRFNFAEYFLRWSVCVRVFESMKKSFEFDPLRLLLRELTMANRGDPDKLFL